MRSKHLYFVHAENTLPHFVVFVLYVCVFMVIGWYNFICISYF